MVSGLANNSHPVFYSTDEKFDEKDLRRMTSLEIDLDEGKLKKDDPIRIYVRAFGDDSGVRGFYPVSQFRYLAGSLLEKDDSGLELYKEISKIDHMKNCDCDLSKYGKKIEEILDRKIYKIVPKGQNIDASPLFTEPSS